LWPEALSDRILHWTIMPSSTNLPQGTDTLALQHQYPEQHCSITESAPLLDQDIQCSAINTQSVKTIVNKCNTGNICNRWQELAELTRSTGLCLVGFKLWIKTCLLTGRRMSLARWLCGRLIRAAHCRTVVTRDATR